MAPGVSEAVTAYIGLGANLGDRAATLREAVHRLGELGTVTGVSSLYETDPVGYQEQPSFLNAVVALQTTLDASSLIRALLAAEASLGRTRSFRNAPRTLDLDLLLLGDTVVATDDVQVPHPRLHERAFVLAPLAELAPDAMHPVLHRSMRQLYDALDSRDGVAQVAGPGWVTLPADGAGRAAGHSGNPASG
jgi:2-amino-4-hydroxy-6-hydroxymethyldihydropteridine diphosphokinase